MALLIALARRTAIAPSRICVLLILWSLFASSPLHAQERPKTVHVFVALCDNKNQGIVPVPEQLGRGDDPARNLYWGAAYGVKTFFRRSAKWEWIAAPAVKRDGVLERIVFKHRGSNLFLVAYAYRGDRIRDAVTDFVASAGGENPETIDIRFDSAPVHLRARGAADLVVYVGHNGLMDFRLPNPVSGKGRQSRQAIVLACASKPYFEVALREAGAQPLLWTTGLMAPEAYTLAWALEGWARNESAEQIRQRAARTYHQYQRCGLRAALRLFVTGW